MRAVAEIGPDEGRELLGRLGTGRAVHTFRALPAVTVSDYAVSGGFLYFAADGASDFADSVRDSVIGFHVEHLDPSGDSGWSVTVFGPAHPVPWPGPVGVQELLRSGTAAGDQDEELFELSLAHLSGQTLRRKTARGARIVVRT